MHFNVDSFMLKNVIDISNRIFPTKNFSHYFKIQDYTFQSSSFQFGRTLYVNWAGNLSYILSYFFAIPHSVYNLRSYHGFEYIVII